MSTGATGAPGLGRKRPRQGEAGKTLLEVIRRAGGTIALAEALGVSKGAVSQWRMVPVHHVAKVHALYGISKRRLLEPHIGRSGA